MICNMRLSNHPMRDAGRLPQRRSLRTRVAAAQHAPKAHRAPAPCLLPPVVNWHLTPRCNYRCKFCFATYRDWDHAESVRDRHDLMKVPRLLREAGASRISFVGGEPFLHPLIDELIAEAKSQGLATGAVTNGSCLSEERLRLLAPSLDWLAFSVDASSDDLHAKMGRGLPTEVTPHLPVGGGSATTASASPAPVPANRHLARTRVLWEAARKLGFRLKLNTVVSRVNLHDDHGMADLAMELRPERWKVFQVLPVEGQNDGSVEPLLITKAEFRGWVERQRGRVEAAGLSMVAETNEQMRSTYAMLDARCRFFANDPVTGGYVYGASLHEPGGVQAAWHSVSHHFDARQFGARGGLYQWGQSEEAWAEQQRRWLPTAEGRA